MIKDSGVRKEFETGAVRDIKDGKGRCDLMPLKVLKEITDFYDILDNERLFRFELFTAVERYKETGDKDELIEAACEIIKIVWNNYYTAMLELSVHFEEGSKKYGENNWKKGIPVRSYLDSAVRHYIKFLRGDDDERHDRATLWNLVCAIWTIENKPEED